VVKQLASAKVASLVINARKRRRKMSEEFEIDWIPEDTGAPYEADDVLPEVPVHTIDKLCKAKYGHVNWARFDKITPKELLGNPHEFDYENGVVYFKNAYLI